MDEGVFNYDSEVDKYSDIKKLKFTQNKKHLPQHPFRFYILGGSGSGKTNLLLDMIFDKGKKNVQINFTRIYLYAKDLTEEKYQFLIKKMQEREEKVRKFADKKNIELPPDFFVIYAADNLDDVVPVDDLDKDEQNLVIFDDFNNEKDQKIIQEYFIRGRKKNASMVYIAQSYRQSPKMMRDQANYAAIFKLNDTRDLNTLRNVYGPDVDKQDFRKMYNDCIGGQKGRFLFIDNGQSKLSKKFRCGFKKNTVW